MFPVRSILNHAALWLRLAQAAGPQTTFHPDDFDIGALPLPSLNHKAYAGARLVAEIDMITVHVTAVKNGFGVSRQAVKRWTARQDADGHMSFPRELVPLARVLCDAGVFRETSRGRFLMLDDPQRIAERFALWERFRSTPYHEIALRTGDVLHNRRLEQKSWHGNGGNIGVGLALDMHPTETPGEDFAATGRHALTMLADRLKYARRGKPALVVRVVSHRQHKFPGRARDPGKWASEHVVVPVVGARNDLVLAHGTTTGTGRPWPQEWDAASPYDMKGRRTDGR